MKIVIFNYDPNQAVHVENCNTGFYGFITRDGHRGFTMHDKSGSWIATIGDEINKGTAFASVRGMYGDLLRALNGAGCSVFMFGTSQELFAWLSRIDPLLG